MIEPLKDLDLSEELYNEPKQQKKNKESGFFNTLTFQVILCLVITISLVLLHTFLPLQYADIDRTMTKQIQNDGGFSEDIGGLWNRLTGEEQPDVRSEAQYDGIVSGESSPLMSESEDTAESGAESQEPAGGAPNTETSVVPENAVITPVVYSEPIVLPLSAVKVTSPYGVREHPITGKQDFHNGLDLAASEGSDIYAVASGTVIQASYSDGYGNHIKIKHADGSESFYAHCSKLLCSEGDSVRQGEVIAEVGSTGMSTGPHLHFSFLINGKYVNPADLIADA